MVMNEILINTANYIKYLLLKTSGGEGSDIHTMTVWLRQYCVGACCRSWWLPGTSASWCSSSPRSWFIWWRKNSTRTLPPMPMPCGGERWVRSFFLYKMGKKRGFENTELQRERREGKRGKLEVYFLVNKIQPCTLVSPLRLLDSTWWV